LFRRDEFLVLERSQGPLSFGAAPQGSYQGNIGIGTIAAAAKLDMNGTVKACEVQVTLQGMSCTDSVFEDDYVLPPLEEVESQIRAKKHPPGVPSASDMKKAGVDIGAKARPSVVAQ
jgi:hypothetical protein